MDDDNDNELSNDLKSSTEKGISDYELTKRRNIEENKQLLNLIKDAPDASVEQLLGAWKKER